MTPFSRLFCIVLASGLGVCRLAAAEYSASLEDHWLALAHNAQRLQDAGDPTAESAWRSAIESITAELPPSAMPLASRLSRFAVELHDHQHDAEAYPLASRATGLAEESGDRRMIAITQGRLGAILTGQGLYARAEPALRRSLALLLEVNGPDALDTAVAENNLAVLYSDTKRYPEAETHLRLALPVYQKLASPRPYAAALTNLYSVLASQHRYEEGAPYINQAWAVAEKNFPDTPAMSRVQSCMAALEYNRGHYKQASAMLKKVIAFEEHTPGVSDHDLAASLDVYAESERALHHDAESKLAAKRAQSLRVQAAAFR
jgi:tetratricopeptide (TPR) repeat protein